MPPEFSNSESDLLNIEATYLQSGGIFKILEDKENNLLGTFALLPINEDTCKLRKMYLAPQARGIGLGKQMLERAINEAKNLGFKAMIIEKHKVYLYFYE